MRSFFAIIAMIGGAVLFGGDPAKFGRVVSDLHYAAIPGSMIAGTALFLCGVFLWLRGMY